MFYNAVVSYKCDSLVRPFPNQYRLDNQEKDFDSLRRDLQTVNGIIGENWKKEDNNERLINLIKQVINPLKFSLKQHPKSKFNSIRSQIDGDESKAPSPDFIYELMYNEQEETRFNKIRGNQQVFLAYHGSKSENFHSIITNGLRNNLNKQSLFGEGIYLSTNLEVSLTYSSISANWSRSLHGNAISLMAVCEVIEHQDVKCSRDHIKRTSHAMTSSTIRSRVKGSMGGEVPDRYFVVRNDDLLRLRYLLVYAPNAHQQYLQQYLSGAPLSHHFNRASFWSRNKFAIVVAAYIGFIVIIGILQSDWIKRLARHKRL